ncbi:Smr/MutS family protein, partial [Chloroflexota bacterium]
MTKVFESISDSFYTAFFQPDTEKRKEAIEACIQESTPVIQSAVERELRGCFKNILKDTWTVEGWKARAQKFYNPPFMDTYKLYLDINIRPLSPKNKDDVLDPLTPEVREKTVEAAKAAKIAISKMEPPSTIALREIDLHNDYKVEVAIPMLEKFLEESYRDNVRRVRIIHGKGIFVLRKAVREYLEKHRLVLPKSISS